MKAFVLTQNEFIKNHFLISLQDCASVSIEDIFTLPQLESIIFAHDEELKKLENVALVKLFGLHVMVISTNPSFEEAQYYMKLGSKGYANANMHASHIAYAYKTILEGNIWLMPDYITQLIATIPNQNVSKNQHLDALSEREKEVALLLSDGDSHKQIADKLDITIRTVKAHATAIYHKLQIKDRLALALLLR